jgi:hypothetical protein
MLIYGMKKWFLVAILIFGGVLHAEPWLTGPLIAPKGTAVPYGDFVVKSYVYFTTNTGSYDKNWHVNSADENFYSLNGFVAQFPWSSLLPSSRLI